MDQTCGVHTGVETCQTHRLGSAYVCSVTEENRGLCAPRQTVGQWPRTNKLIKHLATVKVDSKHSKRCLQHKPSDNTKRLNGPKRSRPRNEAQQLPRSSNIASTKVMLLANPCGKNELQYQSLAYLCAAVVYWSPPPLQVHQDCRLLTKAVGSARQGA